MYLTNGAALAFLLSSVATSGTTAFSTSPHRYAPSLRTASSIQHASSHGRPAAAFGVPSPSTTSLFAVDIQQREEKELKTTKEPAVVADVDVEKLKAMAQKYRAEAAALEAERAQEVAEAAERAFAKFDQNSDGVITMSELKQGLETQLQTDLSQERVEALMRKFDDSGDGKLQLEEFAGVEKFKVALAEMARDEKKRSSELLAVAQREEEAYNQISEILNDRPPTNTDKALSLLPYLFPLLDSLPYANSLLVNHPDNPAAQLLAAAYFAYQSVPLSGFLAFLSLSFLSGVPRINRLVRYNMLQAMYLDVALFVPGVFALLVGGASQLTGQAIPAELVASTNTALFATTLAAILYSSISSVAGQEPDKIPFVSKIVKDRMPSVEMFKDWLDEQKSSMDDNDKNGNGL